MENLAAISEPQFFIYSKIIILFSFRGNFFFPIETSVIKRKINFMDRYALNN